MTKIALNNGMAVTPYETLFANEDGVLYYTDEPDWISEMVTLYPDGTAIDTEYDEDGNEIDTMTELAELVKFERNEQGEIVNIEQVVDQLAEEYDLVPITVSIKKFRKWTDDTRRKQKFFLVIFEESEEDSPVTEEGDHQENISSTDKPDVVKVVRYLRKYKMNASGQLVVDNMSGMTIVAELNYAEKVFCVRWSDCTNDNFCKEIGYETALCNGSLLKFRMPYGIPECGLVSYLGNECEKELYGDTLKSFNDYYVVHKFFAHFTKYMVKEEN